MTMTNEEAIEFLHKGREAKQPMNILATQDSSLSPEMIEMLKNPSRRKGFYFIEKR